MQKNTFARFFGNIFPLLVALAYVPWLLFLYLIVANYAITLSPNDKEIIQKFIEWFGTAYSLFLALVLGYVWTQFDNLDREFDLEVDALASLHQVASYISEIISTEQLELTEEQKRKITDHINNIESGIVAYVKHVVKHYEIEHSDAKHSHIGEKTLASIGNQISLITFDRFMPGTLVSELFRNLNEAMDIRGDRIAHSKQRMPSAVWLVALVSSIVWLVPFLSLVIDDGFAFLFLVGGASFVIIMVLTIVKDLDDPFDGAWKVHINSWYQFLETIEPTLVFVYNIKNTIYEREIKTTIGKLLKFQVCKLRDLTYRWTFERNEWIKLSSHIQDQENIFVKELLSDQYFNDICYSEVGVSELPIIIYRSRSAFYLLLNSHEINNCDDLTKLHEAIRQKINGLNI